MKKHLLTTLALAAVVVSAGSAPAIAQAPQAAADKGVSSQTPLKVTVVISRYQGEKRTSNLPYTFFVNASEKGGRTSLRMGNQVPIPTTVVNAGAGQTSYNYNSVGVSIDCTATTGSGDRFELSLSIQDSQVTSPAQAAGATSLAPPIIQSFTATNTLLLRNGQSVQYTTATDKVSGEVVKIDVTLEVVK